MSLVFSTLYYLVQAGVFALCLLMFVRYTTFSILTLLHSSVPQTTQELRLRFEFRWTLVGAPFLLVLVLSPLCCATSSSRLVLLSRSISYLATVPASPRFYSFTLPPRLHILNVLACPLTRPVPSVLLLLSFDSQWLSGNIKPYTTKFESVTN